MKITKPEMIIFDYGQTLADESSFDGIAGTEAILKYAVKNKYNLTAEQVQAEADKIKATPHDSASKKLYDQSRIATQNLFARRTLSSR